MVTARSDSYAAASGGGVFAGIAGGVPAWLAGVPVNGWVEILGTAQVNTPPTRTVWNIAQANSRNPLTGLDDGPVTAHTIQQTNGANVHSSRLNSWCGMTIDTRTSTIYTGLGGGHNDYFQNEVLALALGVPSPGWTIKHAGSNGDVLYAREPLAGWNSINFARYDDGLPAARHNYYQTQFIEAHNRLICAGGSVSPFGGNLQNIESFDITVATNGAGWDAQGCYPDMLNGLGGMIGYSMCKHPVTEVLYAMSTEGIHVVTPSVGGPDGSAGSGGTYAFHSLYGTNWNNARAYGLKSGAMAVDTTRNRILWTHGFAEDSTTIAYVVDLSNLTYAGTSRPTYTGAAASAWAAVGACCGMVYEPELDAYLGRGQDSGGTVYRIDAATFEVTLLSTTGGGSVPWSEGSGDGNAPKSGVYNKWQRVPNLGGIVYAPGAESNVWFLRLY